MASAGRILIIPRGIYDNTVTYYMLDMVTENYISYIAKKTVVGISPLEDAAGEYWMQMTPSPTEESEQEVQDAFDYVFNDGVSSSDSSVTDDTSETT